MAVSSGHLGMGRAADRLSRVPYTSHEKSHGDIQADCSSKTVSEKAVVFTGPNFVALIAVLGTLFNSRAWEASKEENTLPYSCKESTSEVMERSYTSGHTHSD